MNHRFGGAVLVSLLVVPASGGSGQEPAPPTFKAGTALVTLDLVARDKRGRGVADLRAEEVEIQEDGVKREIASFRFVERAATPEGGPASPTPVAKAPPEDDTLRLLNLVSLVFDVLDEGSRPVARKAALSFLATNLPAGSRMAVFQISSAGLRIVQPFTEDRDALRPPSRRPRGGRRPPPLAHRGRPGRRPNGTAACSVPRPSHPPRWASRPWPPPPPSAPRDSSPPRLPTREAPPGRRGWALRRRRGSLRGHRLPRHGPHGAPGSGRDLAAPAPRPHQGPGVRQRSKDHPVLRRRPQGPPERRGAVPDHGERGQPGQRERVCGGRARA